MCSLGSAERWREFCVENCCVCGLRSCSLAFNVISSVGTAAAAVRALLRAATGRRLDGFVSGVGVTKAEEDREVNS